MILIVYLLCEYESLIRRLEIIEKSSLNKEEITTLLASVMSVSKWVSICYLWRPNLKDEADNHLIELALAGNAKYLVTHNIKDFQNNQLFFPQLSIVKPEYLIRS